MKASRTTITTRVWTRAMSRFDEKVEAACLRRDGYISRVLEVELPHLDTEIPFPNSDVAARFIVSQLDLLDRKPVSFKIPRALAEQLDQVCAAKKIPRDALLNRLVFLLATPNSALDQLFFGGDPWIGYLIKKYSGEEYLRTERDKIFYPLDANIDPFAEIREGIDLYKDEEVIVQSAQPTTGKPIDMVQDENNLRLPRRFYTYVFDNKRFRDVNLFGLNCYMPDWAIPGHQDEATRSKGLDELMAL